MSCRSTSCGSRPRERCPNTAVRCAGERGTGNGGRGTGNERSPHCTLAVSPSPFSVSPFRLRSSRSPFPVPRSPFPVPFLLALLLAATSLGCGEVRGRKKIQEANELYKRGRYREAVAAFEEAEPLVPNLPTLWLNKGYTCRQLIAPGGRDPESRRAADCALAAFRRLHELAPNDPRAEQLTVQTWFDTDDFGTLEKWFLERVQRTPNDYDVVHSLQEVYYKWGKWPQALEWSTRAAALRPNDAEAQCGVATFIWQILAARGGGPDMAAYDPRPRPAPEDAEPAAGKPKRRSKTGEPELVPPPPPPPTMAGDVTGKARIDLADQAIAHLEKAVTLRPHYADAMTYLALLWRQKSFALFAEPAAWQQAVDRANDWQKRAVAARTGKS
jgi:tetratricopeptide (TPR) repeat protein